MASSFSKLKSMDTKLVLLRQKKCKGEKTKTNQQITKTIKHHKHPPTYQQLKTITEKSQNKKQ